MVAGTTIRPIPEGDASSFIIHDNSSEIAKIIPEKYVEPLVIIARIKGFDGVDDYIIHLIKDNLEMFADTRDNLDNEFQQYMHDMIIGRDIPNTWTTTPSSHSTTTKAGEELDDDTTEEENIKEEDKESKI